MAKTRYVAGRPVEIGLGADGLDVQHFEPGDEVAGAADFPTLQGLVRNGWLVPLASYDDFVAAESKDAFGLALAEAMEGAAQ